MSQIGLLISIGRCDGFSCTLGPAGSASTGSTAYRKSSITDAPDRPIATERASPSLSSIDTGIVAFTRTWGRLVREAAAIPR